MTCFFGHFASVSPPGQPDLHMDGHEIAQAVRDANQRGFYSLAWMFGKVSKLAMINPEEAFAEGWVIANTDLTNLDGALLKRSVSRYLNADPSFMREGAPDLEAVERR